MRLQKLLDKTLLSFNLATFLIAEFGFLGVLVKTLTHVPFFCAHP
jgi:hypothetical protein